MVTKLPITPEGYKRLEEELKHLKTVERPNIIKAIAEARAHGDLSENAEYSSARERQGLIEAKINMLEDQVSRAQVIDITQLSGDTIKFGAIITLIDEETERAVTYQIVGEYESDVSSGKLSISSPIARALLNKKQGESIEIETPGGMKFYYIEKISYSNDAKKA